MTALLATGLTLVGAYMLTGVLGLIPVIHQRCSRRHGTTPGDTR